jgi:hypothetical protein
MRDRVPANRAGATLKSNDLALKAIIARSVSATQRRHTMPPLPHRQRGQRDERTVCSSQF